jgi:colicin import membrane protein
MTSAVLHRDTLMPQPPAGMGPGLLLAVFVHLALILAIAYGVRWHASEPEGVEAELWTAVPQVAAPPMVQPPPAPEPAVKPAPPPPRPKAHEEPDAQIAIEKAKREAERRKKEEAEKVAEKRKQEQARQLAEKRKHEQEEKRRVEREEAQRADLRRKNLERMMAQAGAGTPSSTGNAERTSGPSAGYAGRIKARIKPNILYTGTPSANAAAEVEVRLAPDGTIVGQRLAKSSGLPDWDIAVQRAIERTQMLPRDVDGTVPSSMVISFRPLE